MIKPTYASTMTPGINRSRVAQRTAVPQQQPGAENPRTRAGNAPTSAQPSPASPAPGSPAATLTADERRMVETQFPSSKRMSLRLYGPARPATQVASPVGSLIDLKG